MIERILDITTEFVSRFRRDGRALLVAITAVIVVVAAGLSLTIANHGNSSAAPEVASAPEVANAPAKPLSPSATRPATPGDSAEDRQDNRKHGDDANEPPNGRAQGRTGTERSIARGDAREKEVPSAGDTDQQNRLQRIADKLLGAGREDAETGNEKLPKEFRQLLAGSLAEGDERHDEQSPQEVEAMLEHGLNHGG